VSIIAIHPLPLLFIISLLPNNSEPILDAFTVYIFSTRTVNLSRKCEVFSFDVSAGYVKKRIRRKSGTAAEMRKFRGRHRNYGRRDRPVFNIVRVFTASSGVKG
jgi:hypothetical protein